MYSIRAEEGGGAGSPIPSPDWHPAIATTAKTPTLSIRCMGVLPRRCGAARRISVRTLTETRGQGQARCRSVPPEAVRKKARALMRQTRRKAGPHCCRSPEIATLYQMNRGKPLKTRVAAYGIGPRECERPRTNPRLMGANVFTEKRRRKWPRFSDQPSRHDGIILTLRGEF